MRSVVGSRWRVPADDLGGGRGADTPARWSARRPGAERPPAPGIGAPAGDHHLPVISVWAKAGADARTAIKKKATDERIRTGTLPRMGKTPLVRTRHVRAAARRRFGAVRPAIFLQPQVPPRPRRVGGCGAQWGAPRGTARYQRCCSYLPAARRTYVWIGEDLTPSHGAGPELARRARGESVRRPERDARCRRPISEGSGRGAARCIDSNADR
jgi:hypothetical protein